MQVPRWRNVLILKNTLIPAISQSTTSITNAQFAAIHSTPTTWEKRKNKWNGNKWNDDASRLQQPPKNNIKFVTRQKRADAKRALKDLLFNSRSSKTSFQGEGPIWPSDAEHSVGCNGKRKSKSSARHSRKSQHDKRKRRHRRESFYEDFGDAETVFQATFGNRWYTWSFNMSSFQSATNGFEWRDHQDWTNQRFKKWDTTSGSESEDELSSVGTHSDRAMLGLPPTGPLKIEDVKNAFRLSALKWHPDKHQGPSQAMAEEKFKVCVNAYKSLCDALT